MADTDQWTGSAYRAALALAVLCTGLLVYNIAALPIFREPVFLERGMISPGGETIILIGFVLAAIFNFVSLLWNISRARKKRISSQGDKWILALGVLCMILLLGEKTMVDEIGREYLLGWEVTGEWIILYVFLAIQLLYNTLIILKLYRIRKTRPAAAGA